MTSKLESTPVEQIDFGSLSDEDLKDVAENDSRTTAQSAAQAEQNRRASDTGESGSGTATTSGSDDARLSPSVQEQVQPADAAERQKELGFNTEGINLDPDAGQEQLQEAQNNIDKKGFIGGVPDPTPNENYQASNSTTENDLPTPETDADLYNESRSASLGNPLENVERSSVETAVRGDQ